MRFLNPITFAAFVAGTTVGGAVVGVAVQQRYVPATGDTVMLYHHKFLPGRYEEARKRFRDEYMQGVRRDAGVRDTYILESPERAEILGVTFWNSRQEMQEWRQRAGRNARIRAMDPLRREPFREEEFTLFVKNDE